MVTHMKTTIEISDALLTEARRVADNQGVTLRALVETGLRRVLRERQATGFRLRRATFGGHGLQPGIEEGSWNALRDLAYEGRGT
jgi:Arc/MetJ family transcription regulator